jgi:hypothetical protein
MGKGMTMAGMVVAVLIFVLFLLDLILGFPFKRASLPMDVLLVLSAVGLGFLSWSTLRDFD